MKFQLENNTYIDTNKPLDISIELSNSAMNLRAWHVDLPIIEPVRANGFVGAVAEGGSVNFRNISFNPHGHGTHTECLGHITKEIHSVNQSLTTYFFTAKLITITPEIVKNPNGNDKVIKKEQLIELLKNEKLEALIIRTIPNAVTKKHLNYTETNPAYLEQDCIEIMNECGVKHLLIDLPSVDKESDGGELAFHHVFWNVPSDPQFDKTITEFIYVDDSIKDGRYVLELQTAPFNNDASPSRPVLYEINNIL